METELTKKIKNACHFFKPEMPTKLRTIRYADEVWTPTGIVDVIRFEDCIANDRSFCATIEYQGFDAKYQEYLKTIAPHIGDCKFPGNKFPNSHCTGCVFHRHVHDIGMLVTCYEVKISVSDFKSKNGHNFWGNKNYYAVDSRIYESIKSLAPDDIGIIVYYEKTDTMRIKKECAYKEISFETKTQLLYDALKKWVDGAAKKPEESTGFRDAIF